MDDPFIWFLILASIVVGILYIVWTRARGRMMLERWTTDNGYRLLSSEHQWFRRGPFSWNIGSYGMVYFVVVQTPEGETRRGWLKCGSFWWGMMRDKTEVRWEV